MPFTVKDAVHVAREIVQDVGMEFDYDGDRHSDAKLIRCLNMALADMFRVRADLFYPGVHARTPPEFEVADIAAETALPIEATYFSALTDYIAGTVALGDDEFAETARATALLNRFIQKLQARGA